MHASRFVKVSSPKLDREQSIDDFGGCTVSGKGLTRGVVGQPTSFFVHTVTLDLLYLNFTIKGPINGSQEPKSLKADIYCIEPNLHGVVYSVAHPGQYLLTIQWNGKDVHGSPFTANIRIRSDDNSSDENNESERVEKTDRIEKSSKSEKVMSSNL